MTNNTPVPDTTAPTITGIAVAPASLRASQTTTVTFTFSEAVTGFATNDVTVPSGTLSGLESSDGGTTWTATLTPSANVEDTSNQITVSLAGVRNAAGSAGSGTSTASNNYAVDTRPPAFDSATVNGTQLVLTCTEGSRLDTANKPATSAFTVQVNGVAVAVSAVAVDGAAKTVTLTLASAVAWGDAVTISYRDPTPGNDAASLERQAVSNHSIDPALDTDNDGTPKHRRPGPGVPGPRGAAAALGDGDGIQDSLQATAGSASFVVSPKSESKPEGASGSYVTLVMGSQDGKAATGSGSAHIISLKQKDARTGLPKAINMPLGLTSFRAALSEGRSSEKFSLYVDSDLGVNGYWLKDGAGIWVNLASAAWGGKMVHEGGRLRLDFQIGDCGQFDADSKADGIITAPGAAAKMPLSIVGQAPDAATDGFWF